MLYEGIQHTRMFRVSWPSRPNHLPDDLNEESVVSLGIMVYYAQRQMLTTAILLCILYMVCIKNKYSNNVNDERKKGKIHPLVFIIKI